MIMAFSCARLRERIRVVECRIDKDEGALNVRGDAG
jgi:hypothetical protein